jgi:hypothetical protein
MLMVQRDLFLYYMRGARDKHNECHLEPSAVPVFGFEQLWTMYAQLHGSWAAYLCHSLFKNAPRPERIVAAWFVLTMTVNPHLNYILIGYVLRFNQTHLSALKGTRKGNIVCAVATVVFFASLYGEFIDERSGKLYALLLVRL